MNLVTIIVLLGILEMPAVMNWIDYRTFLSPKQIGGVGPHNRVVEAEGYFHRPPHDAFTNAHPGDAALLSGVEDPPLYAADHVYDRFGFRNRDDYDSASVLLIGDSFLEGYKVTQDSLMSAVLARMVPGPVYNMGQADFGPAHELATLEHVGVDLRPSVVAWLFFEGNDLYDFHAERETWTTRSRVSERLLMVNLVRNLAFFTPRLRKSAVFTYPAMSLPPEIETDRREVLFEFSRPFQPDDRSLAYLDSFQRIVLEARDLVQRVPGSFVLVFVPIKARVYQTLGELPVDLQRRLDASDLRERIAEWTTGVGVEYIDLTDPMRRAARAGVPVYYADDAHWTAAGHRIAAEQLAQRIRARGWLEAPSLDREP